MSSSRLLVGLLVALLVGAAGGFALEPVAESIAAGSYGRAPPIALQQSRLLVETAEGDVQVMTASGAWRTPVVGEALLRPIMLKTGGLDSRLRVSFQSCRLVVSHRSMVSLSEGRTLTLYEGQVLIGSSGAMMNVQVPAKRAVLTGTMFGVWVDDRLRFSILEGDVALARNGERGTKYAFGREIMLIGDNVTPLVLPEQVDIETLDTIWRGGRYWLTARGSPAAMVFFKNGREYQKVDVDLKGDFRAPLRRKQPQERELLVYDSAGRVAEVGTPSISIKNLVASLRSATSTVGSQR